MSKVLLTNQEILTIARYLERYSEPLVEQVSLLKKLSFESVIVIPIYDEPIEHLVQFLDFNNGQLSLMVWVFNAPDSAKESSSLVSTQESFTELVNVTRAQKVSDNLWFSEFNESLRILFIDYCHDELVPAKQGVGLARKLGLDVALKLVLDQYQTTQKLVQWIHSTDADVKLPQNYALIPAQEKDVSACVYPFLHTYEVGYQRAMQEYEFSLHYYVESLRFAGSPYAFHTIGSLIAVAPLAYAQVRGIPKRAGAEDFYLLNKLQKVGRVNSLYEPKISIAGRPSQRVPFGTGPALIKIQAQHENHQRFKVYHPRIFQVLKLVLKCVSQIEHRSAHEDVLFSALKVTLLDQNELEAVIEIFDGFSWAKQVKHLLQQKSAESAQQAFHTWFDAFLTLRFVHELRDRLYPNIELSDLPALLSNEAKRGEDFDYIAWFDSLGI